MTEHTMHRIIVVGGGYAGTLAANHLRKRTDVVVTLINPRPMFVDRVRLHQFVAGTGEATVAYDTLLGPGVELVVDSVTRIETATRTVRLASGGILDYDHLIYAVGSTAAVPTVPGCAEFACTVAEFESAQRLRTRLWELPLDAPITVVGGGPTGVETAAELAERGRDVTLVCGGTLLPAMNPPGRRYVATWLARHGVTVLESERVCEVRSAAVVLTGGETRPSALTVWAAGFGVPRLAAASGLRTDDLGRLLTDETLTSVDDDRIVATGDAAAPSGAPLRMCSQAAGALGAQAAETVLGHIAGTEPAAIDLALIGTCVSLGRRAGIRQLARKDDTAVNFYLGGRLGARIKEMTATLAVGKIRREARKPGAMAWVKGGPRPTRPASVTA
ncbi:NAD(P)/FAD-dependent oxidoreductase [Nocardia sp. BMG111209]|uniref:NAD(P)/FAD-dependent oxidoreductase n=1 Tax=Nocardia sp. BMG111209 TaxID=1160137 RepID=UPI00035CD5CE|nr:FAD-dependent oxidoreductase [Nocardia sp. BMG111209]